MLFDSMGGTILLIEIYFHHNACSRYAFIQKLISIAFVLFLVYIHVTFWNDDEKLSLRFHFNLIYSLFSYFNFLDNTYRRNRVTCFKSVVHTIFMIDNCVFQIDIRK